MTEPATPAAPWYVLRHIGTKRYLALPPLQRIATSGVVQDAWRHPSLQAAEAARQYLREFADTYEVMQLPAEQP